MSHAGSAHRSITDDGFGQVSVVRARIEVHPKGVLPRSCRPRRQPEGGVGHVFMGAATPQVDHIVSTTADFIERSFARVQPEARDADASAAR